MGQLNYNPVEPRGNKSVDEYLSYLANLYAMNQDELVSLLEGRLSSINIREIAGFLVDLLTLKHKSGLVGMSAEDPNNPDAVRFWAGDADKETAPYRVTQKGAMHAVDAFITGLITGSTIIGSEIKTSETAFPRMEFSSLETFFKAFGSATKSIEISVSTTGTPGLFFKDDLGTALLDISSGVFDLLSTIAMSISAPNVNAGGDWSFANIITGNITGNAGSANYADRAGTAAASDALAPSGTIAWGQVDKAGSSISQLQTRNLADLTQTAAFRTVTDGEKNAWNAKANKTQEAWITPAFTNNWVNYGSGQATAAYMKDEMGFVTIKAFVKDGTIGTSVFTLPVGYRPGERMATGQVSNGAFAQVDVFDDGTVIPISGSAAGGIAIMIRFRAEQ